MSHRWRALSTREVVLIEDGYQRYMREIQIRKEVPQKMILEPKLEVTKMFIDASVFPNEDSFQVDYLNMEMLRPHHRYLRRTFQTGLWLQYRTSAHQVQLHAKINRLQIDNQLPDCVFPVILAPVPPPKSVALSSGKLFLLLGLFEYSKRTE